MQDQEQVITALKAKLYDANEINSQLNSILDNIVKIVGLEPNSGLEDLYDKLQKAFPSEDQE